MVLEDKILTLKDFENKVIYINTFTKSLSPSFRISYLVLPENLLSVFEEKLGFFSNTVSFGSSGMTASAQA